MASVPREALSVTCTGLLRATHWICCVPERRKAAAVRASLEGPLTTECPGSLIRTHPRAFVYLDTESASLLSEAPPVIPT
jgi:glucosamine-6-phosphate deaminase